VNREVVYQADEPARLIFFDLGRGIGVGQTHPFPTSCDLGETRRIRRASIHDPDNPGVALKSYSRGTFLLDIWGQTFKIENIYSAWWIFIHNE